MLRAPELQKGESLAQHGVYYDDGYDYMQHLRERGADGAEVVEVDASEIATVSRHDPSRTVESLNLPSDVLAPSEDDFFQQTNHMDPRFDWDPEIVRRKSFISVTLESTPSSAPSQHCVGSSAGRCLGR